MLERIFINQIWVGNNNHARFANSNAVVVDPGWWRYDLVQKMDLFLVVNIQDYHWAQTFYEHDFWMLDICCYLQRSEVVDPKVFESPWSYREVRSAGAEFRTFCQWIHIDCFCVLPHHIQKLIGGWYASNLGIIAAFVCNLGNNLLTQKVIDMEYFVLTFKTNYVVVIPPFRIPEESWGEWFDVGCMVVGSLNLALHWCFLPVVCASGHMGFVFSILVVVYDYLLSKFRYNIGVEEYNITRRSGVVNGYGGFVQFVYPETWNLSFHVFEIVLYIWSHCVISKWNFKWFGEVDRIYFGCFILSGEYWLVTFVDKIGCEHLLALEGLVGVTVVWFGLYDDIDFLSSQGRVSIVQSKSILIDFPQPESLWVSNVEMCIFPIKINLYIRTFMIDDVVGIEVGSWSFAKDPSIVIVNGICFILNFRWTLNKYIFIIQHYLLDFAILHQRVFV